MAKVQIKSEKLTPFGGIFSIMEQFDALLAQTIDSSLGLRCTMFGYQYSEILRSLILRNGLRTSRRHVLNIYSDNYAYANLFKTDFG